MSSNRLLSWWEKNNHEPQPSDEEIALISPPLADKNNVKRNTRKPTNPPGSSMPVVLCGILFILAASFAFLYFTRERGLGTVSRAILELPPFPDARNPSKVFGSKDWEYAKDSTSGQDRIKVDHLGEESLAARERCMEEGNCRPNQEKVILVTASDWIQALMNPYYVSGEQIWAHSAIRALDELNYTRFYHSGDMNSVNKVINSRFKGGWDDIHMVISSAEHSQKCAANAECVYSKSNAGGAHLWKTLSFHFWPGPEHPLGRQWVLSPEDYVNSNNMFLGYSVEADCLNTPYIDPDDRFGSMTKANALKETGKKQHQLVDPSRRTAYLLAKKLSYLEHNAAFGAEQFAAAYNELNIRFEIGTNNDSNILTHPDLLSLTNNPAILENHGKTRPDVFSRILSTSRVLIGVGDPLTSPTPYLALCLGVPFINPIKGWDEQDPTDRVRWDSQHDTLKFFDPPYVYNVFRNDTEGFVDAIRSALARPIERFTPPARTQSQVTSRFQKILARDHWALMDQLMKERIRSGSGVIFDY